MKLIPIPQNKYEDYRLTLMFDCYKWDPQFLDSNTIAKYVLVIGQVQPLSWICREQEQQLIINLQDIQKILYGYHKK